MDSINEKREREREKRERERREKRRERERRERERGEREREREERGESTADANYKACFPFQEKLICGRMLIKYEVLTAAH